MGKNKKDKGRSGVVWSTNPDFEYKHEKDPQAESLQPEEQQLKVSLDRKMRAGKVVTLVQGFVGNEQDLKELGRVLKVKCGTGGSVKEGMIILQGDFIQRVKALLEKMDYH